MRQYAFIVIGALSLACGVPENRKCDPGTAATCDGDTLTLCAEVDGEGFIVTETCPAGTTCDVDSASCLPDGGDVGCGNGTVEPPEVCDDGDNQSGDGCRGDCLSDESCGNGLLDVDAGEECDDDNTNNGDGCDQSCQFEFCGDGTVQAGLGEACDDNNNANGDGCNADCQTSVCGDGVLDQSLNPAEECDDGNTASNDGCDSACQFENGDLGCGNGTTEGNEVCDDGDNQSGDGCRGDCLSDESCGNGLLDVNEQCDDGNQADGDGCDQSCVIEFCGDGITNDLTEECDNGAQNSNDAACTLACEDAFCGDGLLQAGVEQCDDANNNNGDGCDQSCNIEVVTFCGDGVVNAGEACDEGANNNGTTCNADCSIPSCGDAFLNPGEACDDGNNNNGDGCDQNCNFEANGAICGNSIVEGAEQCDDGNVNDNDGCESDCTFACGADLNPVKAILDPASGNCLVSFAQTFIYAEAKDACEDKGGYLAVPNSLQENNLVQIIRPSAGDTWIGIDDLSPESNNNPGLFQAVTGEFITFFNFAALEPSGNASENCVHLTSNNSPLWNDIPCDIGLPNFVCEIEPITCGDGVVQPLFGEECDEGESNFNGGACNADCTLPRCGDGIEQEDELCFVPQNIFLSDGTEAFRTLTDDFDLDGFLDLLVVNFGSASVSVLPGRGDGTFGPAAVFGTGVNPIGAATGDINNDGLPDMAVTNFNSSFASFFIGNGDGTFQPPVNIDVIGSLMDSVALGDLNGDGFLDYAITTVVGNNINVGFGSPSVQNPVSFSAPTLLTTDAEPRTVLMRDLDGDGDLDLMNVNRSSNTITTFINAGLSSGTFTRSQSLPTGGVNPSDAGDIDAGFINNDGLLDVVVLNGATNNGGVFFGQGGGLLGGVNTFATDITPARVEVADLNNDGFEDIALSHFFPGTLHIKLSLGNGALAPTFIVPTAPGSNGTVGGDFNRDGRLDLAVAGNSGVNNPIQIHLGLGDGTVTGNQTFATGDSPIHTIVVDVDDNGIDDLITVNFNSDNISILRGNGLGSFGAPTNVAVGDGPTSVVARDFDSDGDLDLAVSNFLANTGSILTNNGNGVFTVAATLNPGTRPATADAGDVDNDGDIDLVFVNEGSSNAVIFSNNGAGAFTAGTPFLAGTAALGGVFVDLNDDGDLDLVTTSSADDVVVVHIGLGNGTFGSPVLVGAGDFPRAVIAADLDNDGDADIIAINEVSDNITVLLNNGAGALSGTNIAAGNSPFGVIADDLDNDGDRDLATINRDSQNVSVLIGNGNGTFQPQVLLGGMGDSPAWIASGDINLDGTPDIIVAVSGFDRIQVLASFFR